MDASDPENPRVVHGFLARGADGYEIRETWDTLGMRATASNDTLLDRAFVPHERIALLTPAGFAGAGLFQLAIFAWGLLGFANVYTGIARRAYDLALDGVRGKRSLALSRSMAYHPEVQHHVAEMRMALETAPPGRGRIPRADGAGARAGRGPHGPRPPRRAARDDDQLVTPISLGPPLALISVAAASPTWARIAADRPLRGQPARRAPGAARAPVRRAGGRALPRRRLRAGPGRAPDPVGGARRRGPARSRRPSRRRPRHRARRAGARAARGRASAACPPSQRLRHHGAARCDRRAAPRGVGGCAAR